MFFFSILSLLILTINTSTTKSAIIRNRNTRIVVTSVECPPLRNHHVIRFYNCTLIPIVADYESKALTAYFEPAVDINSISLRITLDLELKSRNATYLAVTIDGCKEMQRVKSVGILRSIFLEVRRTSNIPFKCPLKKNMQYYFRNYTTYWENMPAYVPELNWFWKVEIWLERTMTIKATMKGRVEHYEVKRGQKSSTKSPEW